MRYQQELLKFLGTEYSIKTIDGAPCIYRKINDNYDLEILGSLKKNQHFDVIVWDISKGEGLASISVEKIFGISGRAALKSIADELTRKYQDLA